MEANTQYNDFKGTSAADISDHTDLKKFLESRGVDTNRYNPIGVKFYHAYNDFFSASIICLDRENSTPGNAYITSIGFEREFDHKDFFNLFKRFNVVLTRTNSGYEEREIDEEITFDDR